jgi:hypothetical protein
VQLCLNVADVVQASPVILNAFLTIFHNTLPAFGLSPQRGERFGSDQIRRICRPAH